MRSKQGGSGSLYPLQGGKVPFTADDRTLSVHRGHERIDEGLSRHFRGAWPYLSDELGLFPGGSGLKYRVKGDTRRYTYVQRTKLSYHWNADEFIRHTEYSIRDPLIFRTHDKHQWTVQVDLSKSSCRLLRQSYDPKAMGTSSSKSILQSVHSAYRLAHQSSSGAFHGVRSEPCGTCLRDQQGMRSETFSTAGDGTHIAHICDTVKGYDEGCFTTIVCHGDHFVKILFLDLAQERDHTLMFRPCDPIQLFHGDQLAWDPSFPGQIPNATNGFTAQLTPKEDPFDQPAGTKSFDNGSYPDHHVLIRHEPFSMLVRPTVHVCYPITGCL